MSEKLEWKEDTEGITGVKTPISLSFRTTFVVGAIFLAILTTITYGASAQLFGNMLMGAISALAISAYFCIEGLIEIPIGHKGVPLIFGERVPSFLLGEGRHWILPVLFMGVKIVDVRTQRKQIPVTKVLSKDEIPLEVTVSLAYRISDPFKFTQVEEAAELLEDLADRTIRWSFREKIAVELPLEAKNLSNLLEEELDKEASKWGLDITKAIVENIRLPESIEKANEQKEVEKSQKDSETIEAEHTLALAQKYKKEFPNLTDIEIFNLIQAERGKIKRSVIDGNASQVVKAAGVFGDNLKGGKQ
ncbi:MAG: SPFH domain-containing protein [Candidatus Lloydbacteria bacterium]|nr:SPFH domain-containing protein [Candidatus Lloydbacteria bacterium]